MSPIMIVIVVFAAVAVVLLLSLVVFPWAIKKGISLSPIFTQSVSTLDDVQKILASVKLLLPPSAALNITELVVKYAKEAVSAAEQLYKSAQLAASERKAKAIEVTYECLEMAGVELTDPVKKLVDELIEGAVGQLDKTHPTTKTKTK